jgi:Fur family iron response transcriptional regulator
MLSSKSVKRVCLTTGEIEARLVERGVQATAQRIAIARYVLCEAEHPTAEDVKRWTDINFPKLSLATVYNTLKILVSAGLIKQFHLPHIDKIIYDNNVEHHHHFFDEKTGQLFDLTAEECEVNLKLPKDFKEREIEVFIRGHKG